MKSLKNISMLAALLVAQVAVAGPLYQWTTADGTPTYSPDPPPEGTDYIIVGPDLLPLAGQPVAGANLAKPQVTQPAAAPAAVTGAKKSADVVMTPAPGAAAKPAPVQAPLQAPVTPVKTTPKTRWKPVQYANDPNPGGAKPVFNTQEAAPAAVTAPVSTVSSVCLNIRQQLSLLESQFANAYSATEMDNAIVRLNQFRIQNKGECGL